MHDQGRVKEAVLFVDDQKSILSYTRSLFENRGLEIMTASSAKEALKLIDEHDVAVVVSDNQMPGMSGIELLTLLKERSPHTVKIMMTGRADLDTTLAAINSGEVFRFVLKPWKDTEMLRAVKDGIRRYRILQSIKREDEFILHSLAQTIELKDACTRGHCDRVATLALLIADRLGIADEVKQEIRYGSWLHDCGKIGVPEAILNAERRLTEEEFAIVKKHPEWGCDVVRKANLSRIVQDIVLSHHERYDGKGYPNGLEGDQISLEAQIVSAADICDALSTDRPYRRGLTREELIITMQDHRGKNLSPRIADTLLDIIIATGWPPQN
ncbi:HD domain-containing phosphohydrolase [Geomesophilobacter sediminis]|uniref:Response regulator n=1 Tax=Geomesophilobacter sediminis TaxID=2798584 RepID=A0A8J7IQ59_9BACT|nr:HD domain-containing phosphohydrolase [Geomesophilobacter sediminis]MBJ6725913.1 response regulator [Geomesophilobacter sediminis]